MSKVTIVLLVILAILIIACIVLYFLGKKAEKKQAEQKEQPQVVGLGTFEQFFNHGLSSLYEVVNAGLRAQVGLAANTVVGGQSLPHR